MNGLEAHKLLSSVTPSKSPWNPNPIMTISQALDIVQKGVKADDKPLSHLMEKRVYQVVRNQRCPRF